MSFDPHFTEEDWARVERDWTAWWAGELDRPLVMVDGLERIEQPNPVPEAAQKRRRSTSYDLGDLTTQPLPTIFSLDVPAEEVIDAYGRLLSSTRFFGDSWPRWWLNFGPGIAAGFLGGRVNAVQGTVWFDMPAPVDIHTWQPSYDADNPWWQRVLDLTRLAVERWGNHACVGHTDLGGNLDILSSFRTAERLLFDLYDAPEEVERLAGDITRLWLRYYDELDAIIQPAGRGTTPWAHIWAPHGRAYMLQSDFCYMISPEMFERFVLPDLAACCDHLDYAFYHLDGKGEIPHLDMLLSLKRLRGIQWIPGDGAPPPEEWLPLLKRIRDGGKLVQLYVSPEGALKIVRELGGQGFALYVNKVMSRPEAESFLRTIAAQ